MALQLNLADGLFDLEFFLAPGPLLLQLRAHCVCGVLVAVGTPELD
jgi:hypothetical protein